MARIENRIQSLPSVLTHGDFNPFNILEGGVIDWERGSYTPLGYDLTSNITQTFFFPLGGDFEYTASYRYSHEQIAEYWKRLDAICTEAGLAPISDYRNDFIFCRCVWSVVRMDRWPKIQAWRNELHKKLLAAYLQGDDLSEFLRIY
jgi:Phosphotransferase enzyme family